jgi:PBP1b-binding outer membrane lipoprotein LpoB
MKGTDLMGRKIKLLVCLTAALLLISCASAGAEELVDYHNSYVENVNSKLPEINTLNEKSLSSASFEEALDVQKNELLPLVNEIKDYIDSQEPESDIVKEYHLLRADQVDTWYEAFQMKHDVLESVVDQSISDEEANEIIMEADEKFMEAGEKAQEADQKMVDLADEHNLELEE